MKHRSSRELKELAGLCVGAALLVGVAVVLSGNAPFLPQQLRLAVSEVQQTAATANAAAVPYWQTAGFQNPTGCGAPGPFNGMPAPHSCKILVEESSGACYGDGYQRCNGYPGSYACLADNNGIVGAFDVMAPLTRAAAYVKQNNGTGSSGSATVLPGTTLTLDWACQDYQSGAAARALSSNSCYGAGGYNTGTLADTVLVRGPSNEIIYNGTSLVGSTTVSVSGTAGQTKNYTFSCVRTTSGATRSATIPVTLASASMALTASPQSVPTNGTTVLTRAISGVQAGSCTLADQNNNVLRSNFGDNGTSAKIYLTSGSSWVVPSDWNSGNNTIEVIGGGRNGEAGTGGNTSNSGEGGGGGGGGGGGAYAKITNLALTPGTTVGYSVGGVGGDSYFCNSTTNCTSIAGSAVRVGAKGAAGRTGGTAAASIGTLKYSGGNGLGAYPYYNDYGTAGGGGGGAGGPTGAGGNGSEGGAGGSGSAGGTPAGSSGTQWDATHGVGGGGRGGDSPTDAYGLDGKPGSPGGYYGAGGGGGGGGGGSGWYATDEGTLLPIATNPTAGGAGGAGRQGIIVITYPFSPSVTTGPLTQTTTYTITCTDVVTGAAISTSTVVGVNVQLPTATLSVNGGANGAAATVYTGSSNTITATYAAGSGDVLVASAINGNDGVTSVPCANIAPYDASCWTQPDATKTYTFTPASPGTYTFYAASKTNFYTTYNNYKSVTVTVVNQCPNGSGPAGACTSCNSGYVLSGGNCALQCPNGSGPAGACTSCNSGYVLQGGSCVQPSGVISAQLIATPSRVKTGTATMLSWTTANMQSCTLKNDSNVTLSTALSSAGVSSGTLTRKTVFTLACTDGVASYSSTATVTLVPVFQEI